MTEKLESPFPRIASAFRDSVQALRIFTEQIGKHADEYDRGVFSSFAEQMTALVGEDTLDENIERSEEGDETKPGSHDRHEASRKARDAEFERRTKAMLDDPDRRRKFYEAVKSFKKGAPTQGETLRRGAIITLVSHFEALIADLIHAFYAMYPQAMPPDERSLTLSELRQLGTVEEAEAFLVSQEVDAVLRDGIDKQIAYFGRRPKVDIAPLSVLSPALVEIAQRRNLYVHNRGRVNRIYLSKVASEIVARLEAVEGKQLLTSDEYLAQSLDTLYAAGVALIQLCWRKWEKSGVDDADSELIDATFDALVENRCFVVQSVAQFASGLSFASDQSRRIILINHAIALRDTGRREEMEGALASLDWSATDLRFRLAIHALREEHDQLWDLMPRAVAAEAVSREHLEEWPLYRPLRGQSDFPERLGRIFAAKAILREELSADSSHMVLPEKSSGDADSTGLTLDRPST